MHPEDPPEEGSIHSSVAVACRQCWVLERGHYKQALLCCLPAWLTHSGVSSSARQATPVVCRSSLMLWEVGYRQMQGPANARGILPQDDGASLHISLLVNAIEWQTLPE